MLLIFSQRKQNQENVKVRQEFFREINLIKLGFVNEIRHPPH